MSIYWDRFYDEYSDMSDDVLRASVMSLENVGSGSEVVDVVTDIDNVEIRLRMTERAMELGAIFSEYDFERLDGEIPSYLLVKLAKYGKIEFGSSEDVADTLTDLIDENAKRALYERAYIDDIRFTSDQLEEIGYDDIDSAHDEIEDELEEKQLGCLWSLLFGWFLADKMKRKK